MTEHSTEAAASDKVAAAPSAKALAKRPLYEAQRAQFKSLILKNPNYFGNLKATPFLPELELQWNTAYEELGCVGFQPQFDRLEAVVYVNHTSGYGGDVCSPGTPEYVRFYLSFDNGATWADQGVASFTAYDIPEGTAGVDRLEYAVTLDIDPAKNFCFANNIARVRAILSWNALPPANDPGFVPVWGDVKEADIQIEPRRLFVIGDLLEATKVKIAPELKAALNLDLPVAAAQPQALSAAELQTLYKDQGIEPHRFALAEVQQLMAKPAASQLAFTPGFQGFFGGLGFDLSDILDKLQPTDGNTRYEELTCIGLDTTRDLMVGIIHLKRPSGYSGGPCTAGSREYVTFWGDMNGNGTFETCLGTTSVNVYDIASIPADGLHTAVFLPVNLAAYRQPCSDGPKVVKVRAILSWNVAPPCSDPNYVPVWGNREETLVHIKPGDVVFPGDHLPFIETVGNMAVSDINTVSGLATGPAVGAGFTADDSPFGGVAVISGHVAYPPDVLGSGATALKYKVYVSGDNGASWQNLNDTFTVYLTQLTAGVWAGPTAFTQAVDGDGWYTYHEDLTNGGSNPMQFVAQNVLARWDTGSKEGIWKIRMDVKDPVTNTLFAGAQVITVRLDNTAPVALLNITSGMGNCADFIIGNPVSGTYSATDLHFNALTLSLEPGNGGQFTAPAPLPASSTLMPLARTYAGGVATGGESGAWTLDTTGLPRCGYVIRLTVSDRTIVHSGFIGRTATDVQGLCLREPSE